MAAARQFGITGFYGEGLSDTLMARLRLSPATVQALADTYKPKPKRKRRQLKAVPAPTGLTSEPEFTFDDLSHAMQAYVRRACKERGIDISQVEINSLRKVVIP